MLTEEEIPACPVATAVALIGSKWKLLIIRNLLVGWAGRKGLCTGLLGSAQTRQGRCPCTPPPFEKGGPKL